MRWRVWFILGLLVCVLGLGAIGYSEPKGIQGGVWLENAVWVKTYLNGYSLAYAPSMKLIATPGGFGQIFLYRAVDGALVRVLRGHAGSVNYLAFSRDGKLLASASQDETIALWDPVMGRVLRTMTRHSAPVNVVLFSEDDRSVLENCRRHPSRTDRGELERPNV